MGSQGIILSLTPTVCPAQLSTARGQGILPPLCAAAPSTAPAWQLHMALHPESQQESTGKPHRQTEPHPAAGQVTCCLHRPADSLQRQAGLALFIWLLGAEPGALGAVEASRHLSRPLGVREGRDGQPESWGLGRAAYRRCQESVLSECAHQGSPGMRSLGWAVGGRLQRTPSPCQWSPQGAGKGWKQGAAWDPSVLRRAMGRRAGHRLERRNWASGCQGRCRDRQAPRPALGKEWCAGNLGGGLGSLGGGLAGRGGRAGRSGWSRDATPRRGRVLRLSRHPALG